MDASLPLPTADASHPPGTLSAPPHAGRAAKAGPWAMLLSRTVLFALFQAAIAGVYGMQGAPAPWSASVAWWPVTATLTNLVCIQAMRQLARAEGLRYRDLLGFDRRSMGRDALVAATLFVASAPIAYLPNVLLATWLFGDAAQPLGVFVQPLPLWVTVPCLVLFPVTIALSELPTFYGYVMPRLARLTGKAWVAVVLAGFWHAAQHATLPLVPDARFILWRLGMFLLFALYVAVVVRWRPRLMPYLMVGHGLLDATLVPMILALPQP
jgi:hypothetical protein